MTTIPPGSPPPTLSPLTLGGWSLIGDSNWGAQEEADSLAAVEVSLELGVTSFDTAPMYGDGRSEIFLGKALKGVRGKVLIATKVAGFLGAKNIRESCEQSLRRLQTDCIDLLQIHWPDRSTALSESADALLRLQAEGKIRNIGVCNFGPKDLERAARLMPVKTNQMPYSLLWRGLEFEVLPVCERHGIEVMTYSSLMQGLLGGRFNSAAEVPEGRARTRHFSAVGRPKIRHGEGGHETATFEAIAGIRRICAEIGVPMATASLLALLARPGVVSVIAGARNAGQARENAEILRTRLSPEAIGRLWEATDALKRVIGPELDAWASPSRIE